MRRNTQWDDYRSLSFVVVSEDAAQLSPYPYVYVTDQGEVHELDAKDRSYLETRFHPCDGGRPYVKAKYTDKNGWGELGGFCPRSEIPDDVPVVSEPVPREPPKPIAETIRELTEKVGWIYEEKPDGTIFTRRREVKKWWQFWK